MSGDRGLLGLSGQQKRVIRYVLAGALLSFALGLHSPAVGSAFLTEQCYWPRVESGQSIPWTNNNGLSAYFDAKDDWNALPTKPVISGSGTYIEAYYANYGNVGWDGRTTFTCSNGVFQAPVTVKVNSYYGETGSTLEGVATHEFGHALGLGHSTSNPACGTAVMYYETSGCRPADPQQDDINGLNYIYP